MEPPFDKLGAAVVATTSGYCGGDQKSPTYKQVSAGKTGHAESLQVTQGASSHISMLIICLAQRHSPLAGRAEMLRGACGVRVSAHHVHRDGHTLSQPEMSLC